MLIGLIGKKSSGKDTFGNILINQYGFKKRAFADPLKDCCELLFNLSKEQLNDEHLKETIDVNWQMTPREIMQKVGTDLFRNHFNKDFWLLLFKQWYLKNSNQNIICTDVRFQNEADLIKNLGGIIIKIDRHNNTIDSHESESLNIDFYDYIIYNHDSLENYISNINSLINIII